MRASEPGQSALLMAVVAESLTRRGVQYAVIGAMAAAVRGVVRASLDAGAIVSLQVREAQALRQSLLEEGYEGALRTGDVDDRIPGMLEIQGPFRKRVDLLLGLRGMDPELLNRSRQVRLGQANPAIVSREHFIAMKAIAGGPVDLLQADTTCFSLVGFRRSRRPRGFPAAGVWATGGIREPRRPRG